MISLARAFATTRIGSGFRAQAFGLPRNDEKSHRKKQKARLTAGLFD
jgi:hypothetical protein